MAQPQEELDRLLTKPDITDEERAKTIQLMYDLAVPERLRDTWPDMADLEAHIRELLTADVSASTRNVNLTAFMTLRQLCQMLGEASVLKLMESIMAEVRFDYNELMAEDNIHTGMRQVAAGISTSIYERVRVM